MNTHNRDHYHAGDRIRITATSYDGSSNFTNIGDLGTVTSQIDNSTYEVQLDKGNRTKTFSPHQLAPATPLYYQSSNGDVWERYGAGYRLTHDRAVTVGWDEAVSLSGPLLRTT